MRNNLAGNLNVAVLSLILLVGATSGIRAETRSDRVVCATEQPGPGCPPLLVAHPMAGVVDGQRVTFLGWHGLDGKRYYRPNENPELEFLQGRKAGPVTNYGVTLPQADPLKVEHGPILRTNDPAFGSRWNEEVEFEQRRCPGPGPCPDPSPPPSPDLPDGPDAPMNSDAKLVYIVAAALGSAAFFVIVGAMLVSLLPRKA